MDKNTIRRTLRERSSDVVDFAQATEAITAGLAKLVRERDPQTLIVYTPLPDEVPIGGVLSAFSGRLITLAPDDCELTENFPPEAMIIVPGRAFSRSGQRIGRGGGWYDRLLVRYPHWTRVGVCYDFRLFDDLPQDPWDQKMDLIVTENGFIYNETTVINNQGSVISDQGSERNYLLIQKTKYRVQNEGQSNQ